MVTSARTASPSMPCRNTSRRLMTLSVRMTGLKHESGNDSGPPPAHGVSRRRRPMTLPILPQPRSLRPMSTQFPHPRYVVAAWHSKCPLAHGAFGTGFSILSQHAGQINVRGQPHNHRCSDWSNGGEDQSSSGAPREHGLSGTSEHGNSLASSPSTLPLELPRQ